MAAETALLLFFDFRQDFLPNKDQGGLLIAIHDHYFDLHGLFLSDREVEHLSLLKPALAKPGSTIPFKFPIRRRFPRMRI